MKIFFVAILLMTISLPATAGRESGGQFKYYETIKLIEQNALDLARDIESTDAKVLNDVFDIHKIDAAEIADILRRLQYVPEVENPIRTRKNPLGIEEPLILDHSNIGGVRRVLVLKEFLDLATRDGQNLDIRRHLLHESLHFYQYGQDEAWEYSKRFHDALVAIAVDIEMKRPCLERAAKLKGRCVFADDMMGTNALREEITNWLVTGKVSPKKVILFETDSEHKNLSTPGYSPRDVTFDLSSKDRKITIGRAVYQGEDTFYLVDKYLPKKWYQRNAKKSQGVFCRPQSDISWSGCELYMNYRPPNAEVILPNYSSNEWPYYVEVSFSFESKTGAFLYYIASRNGYSGGKKLDQVVRTGPYIVIDAP